MSTTQDIDTPAFDTRVAALMKPFRQIAVRSKRLDEDRREARAQLLRDLAWMDVPTRLAIATGPEFEEGTLVHVNEVHYKEDGPKAVADAHAADHCNGRWCRRANEVQWTRGKNAVGWKHLGVYRALTTDERGRWICVPERVE